MSHVPLSRRTALQGVGTALALPFLEVMLPRTARAAETAAPLRMACIFFPNGAIMQDWKPVVEGKGYELPPTLESLKPVKDQFLVLSGLTQDNARAKGDGPGDHARSSAAFLTGSHPFKTAGADIKVGMSVDQAAAEKVGQSTKLPSLEIGIEKGRNAGQCDSGYSCVYSNTISWKSATTPMAKEIHPKLVFERLFGAGAQAEQAKAQRDKFRKSVLDLVADDAARLNPKLGKTDQRKLDEYFSSVREIEQRIARSTSTKTVAPKFDAPENVPSDVDEHITLMYDLLTLAFQTDTTRVATFMLGNEGSNRAYRNIGVKDGHHEISHHQNNKEKIEKIKKIDQYLVSKFANFLRKLSSIREGEGTLLDHSMILYGCAIADGNAHAHHDLPILLAGKANGTLKPGRHVEYGKDTPLNNLFLSMLDRMEAPLDRLGDSTGRVGRLDG